MYLVWEVYVCTNIVEPSTHKTVQTGQQGPLGGMPIIWEGRQKDPDETW